MKINKRLNARTVRDHLWQIKRFLRTVPKAPADVTEADVQEFMARFLEAKPRTYRNVLDTLRTFFRDFMQMPQVVERFEFPEIPFEPKRVPSKEEIKTFYSALETHRDRALFLFYATTGLRRNEVLDLARGDVDFEKRMVIPRKWRGTKNTWITFYNDEAEAALKEWLGSKSDHSPKLFPIDLRHTFLGIWREANAKTGVRITPQMLREWFCSEMGRLGVPDRYVDAFCGRTPKSVLAKYYSDFSPERLKEIYDKAGLRLFNKS